MTRLNSMKKCAFISIVGVIALFHHPAITASGTRHTHNDLDQVEGKIRTTQWEIDKAQTQHDALERQLRDIEVEISNRNRAIHDNRERVATLTETLQDLNKEKKQAGTTLAKQQQLIKKQLTSALAAGRHEPLKLLVNQNDPARLGRSLTYHRYLHEARMNRIKSVTKMLATLERTVIEVKQTQHLLKNLGQQQKTQQQRLEGNRKQRKALVAKLDHEIRKKTRRLSRLQEDADSLKRTLRELSDKRRLQRREAARAPAQNSNFDRRKGSLPWPTRGSLVKRFGDRRIGSGSTWQGVLIKAEHGKKVRSIAPGRVVFANWLRGFGLLIIVDHSDEYLSLYGQNQVLLKNVGDAVEEGEVIANVGDSGGQRQSGLYFEVRHKGQPVDPANWCKG